VSRESLGARLRFSHKWVLREGEEAAEGQIASQRFHFLTSVERDSEADDAGRFPVSVSQALNGEKVRS